MREARTEPCGSSATEVNGSDKALSILRIFVREARVDEFENAERKVYDQKILTRLPCQTFLILTRITNNIGLKLTAVTAVVRRQVIVS